MITNPERTTLLSSMGWVDHDALWHFDVATGTSENVPLDTGARYSSLHYTGSDRFAVAHHFDGRRFELSVRSFSAPSVVLARGVLEDDNSALSGDATVWADIPHLYTEYLAFAPWRDSVLLKVTPSANNIEVQRFEW